MKEAAAKRKKESSLEPSKRPRVQSTDVIIIEDSDEEEDFNAILEQIQELERRGQSSRASNIAGPSRATFIDVDYISSPQQASSQNRMVISEEDEEEVEIVETSQRKTKRNGPTITISDDEIEISGEIRRPPPISPRNSVQPPHKSVNLKPKLLGKEDLSPDVSLAEYRDVFTGEKPCYKCKKLVTPPRGYVMFKGDSTLPNSLVRLLHAPCASCRTNHCRGCMKPITCTSACTGNPKKGQCTVVDCCAAVRAIALFEALGGFDRLILGERSTSETRVAQLAEKGKKAASSVGPGGTGYGLGGGGGRSWGSGTSNTERKPTRAEGLAKHWDELVVRAFHVLVELLPNPFAETTHAFDFIPHPTIGTLASLSRLPELLATLLRNDSVIEWTSRAEVYQAMITLLRRLADCELTITVLLQERSTTAETCGLEPWMWKEGTITWKKLGNGDIEKDPPLYDYFKRLIKQGEIFLSSASQMMDSQTGDDEQGTTVQAISLCGDIIAAGGDIERVMSLLGETGMPKDQASNTRDSLALEKVYGDACEKIAFKYVVLSSAGPRDSGLVYPNFNYASDLQQTQNFTRVPKNQFRLASELAVMATSLPAGVWVRVDEVRNDAIKFMIAGPEGTPYEGGLFEFDCLMPLDYPNSPPRVHLRTTGGGTVRFNPNLYNCGKVCLSLLGTWPGRAEEQWSSSKSTLLQVIVSIQSMIFIEAPYFNEPGHGKVNVNSQASKNYNKDVSYNTVRWAILDWLEESKLSGMWNDVIVSHFMIKGAVIRARIQDWSSSDSRLSSLTIKSRKEQALREFDKRIELLDSRLI